ncbi:MAG: hypothetical protein ACD_78C00144G0003 [uncultured bacterium (gcode 4)]|uniref:Uncharacterized protein n=1 Tax=uncultured bacterium (gcode 4) TaxID=1234023 RepID=K1XIM3_9BACT|nr:MAG: hypothetical protein ACD_78C00144G0003 [uncultured bacterium (gcode 4)]
MNNKLIVVFGLPWSGKSTVARVIHEYYGDKSIVLRTDEIRQELFPISEYTQEESNIIYAEFYKRAEYFLNVGKIVILDGVFAKQSERDYAQFLVKKVGSFCSFIQVISDEKYIKKRLIQRKWDVSEADYEVYIKLKAYFEKIVGKCNIIDNSGNMKDLELSILSILNW